jgi:polyhydroxyalkanoate synthase
MRVSRRIADQIYEQELCMVQDQGGKNPLNGQFFEQFFQPDWLKKATEANQALMKQFFGGASQFMPPQVTIAGLGAFEPGAHAFADPTASLFPPLLKMFGEIDADRLRVVQGQYLQEQKNLWEASVKRSQGQAQDFKVQADAGDRRFAAPEWQSSPIYDYIHQAYLLNTRMLRDMAELLPAEDEKGRMRIQFLVRQITDALAPTNFAATNPEFVQRAMDTQGESIRQGIQNLIQDMEKGRITMTDESQFEVGGNLATTAGSVVYENPVMQLIQYAPLTPKVAKRPLLVVPPCINKFYIMDLQPENSLIRFMVEQGNTVFLVSWKNPSEAQSHLRWDDYLEHGPIAAFKVVQEISGQDQINALGFCIGGTLLSSALAVLKARGESPAASLTLLTTLLDFSDTGEIGLFIDDATLAAREKAIGGGGLLQARELQSTFSALRPNDLVWNYVANHYLKGQSPQAFDLLYWNSDSTHLPGPFACWYMRNLYLNNLLREAGKLSMCGTTIDLGALDMPTYLLATREDHIVPWHSAFESTHILGGDIRFVLGASGHIAGVINPASKNKRSYWTNDQPGNNAVAVSAAEWLNAATEQKGSWWNDWQQWLQTYAGGQKVAPKKAGNTRYKAIEPAPGRYVKERVV